MIRDFNFSSLHEEIKPLFFHYHPGNPNIIVSFQSNDYSTLLVAEYLRKAELGRIVNKN